MCKLYNERWTYIQYIFNSRLVFRTTNLGFENGKISKKYVCMINK